MVGYLQRPGGAATCMPWRLVCDEHASPEPNLISVVQDSIDLRRGIAILGVLEVLLPAGFDDRHVAVHHHVLGAGLSLHLGTAGVMIPVRVTDQQDMDVSESVAEFLDTVADLRDRDVEVGIDKYVACGCNDQVGGQILAANIVEIGDNAKGINRCCLIRVHSRVHCARQEQH